MTAKLLSREGRITAGLTLLSVPSIVWGGLTMLTVITQGAHGTGFAPMGLSEAQQGLYRAGHAHAGVLMLLSLALQVLVDGTSLSVGWKRAARWCSVLGAVLVSAGFFGLAHTSALIGLLWAGVLGVLVAVVTTGVGLIRTP